MVPENRTRAAERWNQVFKAIAAEPRRQLLISLGESQPNRSVPLPDSAMAPAVSADPQRLKQELCHTHLPMLADLQFVEWETSPLVASRGPRFHEVDFVFEALQSSAEMPDSLAVGYQD